MASDRIAGNVESVAGRPVGVVRPRNGAAGNATGERALIRRRRTAGPKSVRPRPQTDDCARARTLYDRVSEEGDSETNEEGRVSERDGGGLCQSERVSIAPSVTYDHCIAYALQLLAARPSPHRDIQ